MIRGAVAGALFALATIGAAPALAQSGRIEIPIKASEVDSNIARFKSVLRLTPSQERYWPPVEAEIREIARYHQHQASAGRSLVQRVGDRATAIVLTAAALRRLTSVARPLVSTLNRDQKRDAMVLARAMGLGHVMASLH
jgi:zinc resistance-associated protein